MTQIMEGGTRCSICNNLYSLPHELLTTSLLNSSCLFCTLVKDAVSAFVDDFSQVDELQIVQDYSLYVRILQDKTVSSVVELFTPHDRPSFARCVGPARAVSGDSSSPECIALARQWLDQCLSTHPDCRRTSRPILPTRVISVGTSDEEVKLITNTSKVQAEYAALSHCWGGSHPIALTKASLDTLHQGITFDASSKTFGDAVRVTRSLGIPYLWIDSLCILQDSDDASDWEREAAVMGQLYSNATVTISASSASDTSGGLFVDAQERSLMNKVVQLSHISPDGQTNVVFARARTPDVFDTTRTAHSSKELEPPRTASRGWVLQEENLSPRMLHFRKEELSWTCSTYSQCECRIRPSLPLYRPFRSLQALELEKDAQKLTSSMHNYWPMLVMEYTRRNLTRISDRIPALNGLANILEERTGDMYLCGLWHDDLAFQLLWYVDPKANSNLPPLRFKEPYSPTWSWMSVPGVISYWERHPAGSSPRHADIASDDAFDTYLRVVNVGRIPVTLNNPSGPLFRGELMLYAYALPVSFDPTTEQWQTTQYHIPDMMPASIRTYIDVEDDLPKNHLERSYAFLFAGRWVAQGVTLSCFETVCLLVRRMATDDIEAARTYQGVPEDAMALIKQRTDHWQEYRPGAENSYHRIGVVRNTGSVKAWEKAGIPFEPAWLF